MWGLETAGRWKMDLHWWGQGRELNSSWPNDGSYDPQTIFSKKGAVLSTQSFLAFHYLKIHGIHVLVSLHYLVPA
jgi:hypothetical protein